MTTENNGTQNAANQTVTRESIISLYMEQVLEHEKIPSSVYKFCKEHHLEEAEFYSFFGSFEGIQLEIWNSFYRQTIQLINKDASYEAFPNKEKMLTFFYTFFEVLTLNRSYVLFALNENKDMLRNLRQLKGLRIHIKEFAAGLIEETNEGKNIKILKKPVSIFSEGAWIQTLFLLKYWVEDNSQAFENTDIAIEKSVRAIFDLFDTSPLESVLDFGKFLWKEKKV